MLHCRTSGISPPQATEAENAEDLRNPCVDNRLKPFEINHS